MDKSAVSRFASKLGYAGFGEFREAAWQAGLAQGRAHASLANDHPLKSKFQSNLGAASDAFGLADHNALETGLHHSARLVADASRIVVLGAGSGRFLTQSCAIALRRLGKPLKTHDVSQTPIKEWRQPNDLLVVVHLPRIFRIKGAGELDTLRLPQSVGPVIFWTTKEAEVETHDYDIVLRVMGDAKPSTIATTMVAFSSVFAEACRGWAAVSQQVV